MAMGIFYFLKSSKLKIKNKADIIIRYDVPAFDPSTL
jgi:hypothetical protein